MTTLFDDEQAKLIDDLVEDGAKLRRDRLAASERDAVNAQFVEAFDIPFADELLAAYRKLAPAELLKARHLKRFAKFQEFAKSGGAEVMPAHPAVIGCYLLHMLTIEKKSLGDLRSAGEAITFVHAEKGHAVDQAYILAALDIATELASGGGDNGGGESVSTTDPPPLTEEPMPLAAAGA
jgi:hypothetical protein